MVQEGMLLVILNKEFMMRMLLLLGCAMSLLVGCYRMPTDDDCCVIPATNNPDLKNMRSDSYMPSVGY